MTSPKNTPARKEIMGYIENFDDLPYDFEVPADVYAQAQREGLAEEFSFFIRHTPADQNPNGDEAITYAAVYPNGMDSTWQAPDFVAPMLPEANVAHECGETEWHFDTFGYSAGDMAKLLSARGMNYDADAQKYFSPQAQADVEGALKEFNAKTAGEQVLELVDMQVMDVPDALYERAVGEGFARNFQFCITYAEGYDQNIAFIYPKGKDLTWRGGGALLRPLLPEAYSQDECMSDEWHFEDSGIESAGDIAKVLFSRGFTLDAEEQKSLGPDLLEEILSVMPKAEEKAPAKTAKPSGPKK